MFSHIIWDFNGTILDDTAAAIKSENTLLSRRNMPIIRDMEHYHSIFCFPIIEYYKKLGHDFEKESYDEIAKEWVEEYLQNSKNAPLHRGVIELFKTIKSKNIPQIILSATELQMLKSQINSLEIYCYFDEILGLDNIHAYSKIEIAKQWIKKIKPQKMLLIGDTTHDFEVAKEIGAECILIANGHQSKETLSALGVPFYDNLL